MVWYTYILDNDHDSKIINGLFVLEVVSMLHTHIIISSYVVIAFGCVSWFVDINVSFTEMKYMVNEANGTVNPVLTLDKPSPCCLQVYVEVENKTATGKLYICAWRLFS